MVGFPVEVHQALSGLAKLCFEPTTVDRGMKHVQKCDNLLRSSFTINLFALLRWRNPFNRLELVHHPSNLDLSSQSNEAASFAILLQTS